MTSAAIVRSQFEEDAAYWLGQLAQHNTAAMARRLVNAFLGDLYRLYSDLCPRAPEDQDKFFAQNQDRTDYLVVDTLAMLVRGAGVHDLDVDVALHRRPLHPSPNTFPSEDLFPGANWHFPARDERMSGLRTRSPKLQASNERRCKGYDDHISGALALPVLRAALGSVRKLAGEPWVHAG